MKVKIFLGFCFLLLFNSCSLFYNSKKTTVVKREKYASNSALGRTDDTTIIETLIERRYQKGNKLSLLSPPAATYTSKGSADSNFVFIPNTTRITLNGKDTITMITDTTSSIKPVSFNAGASVQRDDQSSTVMRNCYARTVKIDATSSTFMNADYASQSQYILPGLIYEYNDFISGNYKEIDQERNPIVLSTDNPNVLGGTKIEVDNPNIINNREGVARLFYRFLPDQTGTMNLRYQTYEVSNNSELTLRIYGKATAKQFTASATIENEYSNNQKNERHYLTIDVIKPLFTINALKKNPKIGHFKDSLFTATNPIKINSVTYGMRILANFTIVTKTEEEFNKFKSKYESSFVDAQLDFDYIANKSDTEKTVNCYVVGGPINSTISFSKDQLEKNIQELLSGLTYASARPISYTLSDLAGNIIETRSSTDSITTQYCFPNKNPKLKAIRIKFQSGDDGKDGDTRLYLKLFQNNDVIAEFNNLEDVRRDVNYHPNTTTQKEFVLKRDNLSYNDLSQTGGKLEFAFGPNGDDTWKLQNVSIVFVFENEKNEPLVFTNVILTDETRFLEFYFTGFKPQ